MIKTLFVSYNHKDEVFKDYVVSHLGVAKKQGLLNIWDDRRIKGGGDWQKKIKTALAEAKVAILLVSRHSLTSDFILNDEVSTMLRRRDQEDLVIYPIIIRACDWDAVDWLKAMNLRPTDGKPLARFSLDRRDEVMAGISKEIRGLLDDDVDRTTTPEALAPSPVDDEIDRLAQQTESLSAELGTTEEVLNSMFEILADQTSVPVEQLEAKLREIAERHVDLTKLWQALPKSNDHPEIDSRREQAAQALEEGDYDQADDLLEGARSIIRQAREEHQKALDHSLLGEASILSQQGELERARLNYRMAAEHFSEAASLVPSSNEATRLGYLHERTRALFAQAKEFGDNVAAADAIEGNRNLLTNYPRDSAPHDWARYQFNLGNALWVLGSRESGKKRLEQAVTAFQAALEEFKREHVPEFWAMAQMNLGTALSTLGERESGTTRLENAVNAFQAALEERTRQRVPAKWAMTQMNLGTALRTLGERESGTARLEQAIDAFHAALEEWTREHVPLDWAKVQMNLGTAFFTIGERESGIGRIQQAIAAYQAALEEWPRKRVPLNWAKTQMNLGEAFAILGEREGDIARLEEAICFCEAALGEFTRDRAPLEWATTQHNLGTALRILGTRNRDPARLQHAVKAYNASLEERTRSSVPLDWAKTQMSLGEAFLSLSEYSNLKKDLEAALQAITGASNVYLNDAGQTHRAPYFRERLSKIEGAMALAASNR